MRGLGAAQLHPPERQRNDLERYRCVDRARLGDDAGQSEHDRHEQHEGAAEQ